MKTQLLFVACYGELIVLINGVLSLEKKYPGIFILGKNWKIYLLARGKCWKIFYRKLSSHFSLPKKIEFYSLIIGKNYRNSNNYFFNRDLNAASNRALSICLDKRKFVNLSRVELVSLDRSSFKRRFLCNFFLSSPFFNWWCLSIRILWFYGDLPRGFFFWFFLIEINR